MKLNEKPKITKVVRFTFEDWARIKKYAEGVDFPTETALLRDLIKRGIESAEEEAIDTYIEKEKKDGIKAYTYDGPPIKATLEEKDSKEGGTIAKPQFEATTLKPEWPHGPERVEESETDFKPIDRTKFGTIPEEDFRF